LKNSKLTRLLCLILAIVMSLSIGLMGACSLPRPQDPDEPPTEQGGGDEGGGNEGGGNEGGGNEGGGGNEDPFDPDGDEPAIFDGYDERNLTPQQYALSNLTSVDDYGRKVFVADTSQIRKVGDNPNNDRKFVGVFYSCWIGNSAYQQTGIYDMERLAQLYGESTWPEDVNISKSNSFHFSSEPLFGYYNQNDPWVIARHVELLTMSGVDYLMIDATNSLLYGGTNTLLLDTLDKYYDQGWDVPKVAFYTNSKCSETVVKLYTSYTTAWTKYNHLWFRFPEDDRPVLVGVATNSYIVSSGGSWKNNDYSHHGNFCTDPMGQEMPISPSSVEYNYFNFYQSQWPNGKKNENRGFPWMHWVENEPHANGNMVASIIQHSWTNVNASGKENCASRGYYGNVGNSQGGKNADWAKGDNFNWQWKNVFNADSQGRVRNVLCTGWNEWQAIRNPNGGTNSVNFCDVYRAEYSRDIEMGKTYGDGFYNQLLQNVRKFKFKEQVKYESLDEISIYDLSDFSEWDAVLVEEYADFEGDAMNRSYGNAIQDNLAGTYVDSTARNDIVSIKVAVDGYDICIMVETKDDITTHVSGDKTWMNLMISTGNSNNTFMGYDYIINRSPASGGTTSIEYCTSSEKASNGPTWANSGDTADYAVSGNKIAFRIPVTALGFEEGCSVNDISFSFKVTDNVKVPAWFNRDTEMSTWMKETMKYYTSGDSAPIGRLGYAYNMGTPTNYTSTF